MEAAAEQLAGMGADVDEVSAPIVEYAGAIYMSFCDVDNPRLHEGRLYESPEDYDYATRVRLLLANIVPASMVSKAHRARALLRREMHRLMETVDVVVSPTTAGPAPPIETAMAKVTTVDQVVRGVFGVRNNSTTFNMVRPSRRLRALRLFERGPAPRSPDSPAGCTTTRPSSQVAHAYEQANDWWRRRPDGVSGR